MKTAMQELIEYAHDLDFGGWEDVFIQKATELLEKENVQIINDYMEGVNAHISYCNGKVFISKEEYYNQTYNQNK